MRARRYSTEGALTQHTPQDVIVPREDFTPLDLLWQTLGFTPAKMALQYEENEALRRAEKRILDRRSRIIDAYALALFNDDKKGMDEALDAVARFNQHQPEVAIDSGNLNSSALTRARRSALSEGGVTLNQRLLYLHDEYSFRNSERAPASPGDEENDE